MQSEFVTEILGARLPTRTVPDEDQQRFSTLREWVDEIREADLDTGEKTTWNEMLPRRAQASSSHTQSDSRPMPGNQRLK